MFFFSLKTVFGVFRGSAAKGFGVKFLAIAEVIAGAVTWFLMWKFLLF